MPVKKNNPPLKPEQEPTVKQQHGLVWDVSGFLPHLRSGLVSSTQENHPNINASRFQTVFTRAAALIGNEQDTLQWLGTPVPALNYATPVSLLGTPEGEQAVLAVLTRAEHGAF